MTGKFKNNHKPSEDTFADRKGIDDHEINLSNECHEHWSVTICVRSVSFKSWKLTYTCIVITHGEDHETSEKRSSFHERKESEVKLWHAM